MLGERISMVVELNNAIATEKGMHFAIHEGGRTVGKGVSTVACLREIKGCLYSSGLLRSVQL